MFVDRKGDFALVRADGTLYWQLILKRALANILLPILPTVLSWSKHPADLNLVSLPVRVLIVGIESYLAVVEFETNRGISNLKPEVYVYKVRDGGIFKSLA